MEENVVEEKKEKKGTNKLLIIGGIFFILVILVAGFFIISSLLSGGTSDDGTEIGPVYMSKEYTVNLLEAGGRRFLRVKFAAEVDHKRVLSEIERKSPMVDHTVNSVLGSQTLDDLEVPGSRDRIGAQLRNALNQILDDGEITNIFFEVFVWQ